MGKNPAGCIIARCIYVRLHLKIQTSARDKTWKLKTLLNDCKKVLEEEIAHPEKNRKVRFDSLETLGKVPLPLMKQRDVRASRLSACAESATKKGCEKGAPMV